MPINIREITDDEREQLREITSCTDEAVARRARAVLVASEGTDCTSIAQSLETSERTVRYAVTRFNDGGPEALRRRVSPGRPRSVSDIQRESLAAMIRRLPAEFGIPAEQWTLADLVVAARNEDVLSDVPHWTLRREIVRLINADPELRSLVDLSDQKQPGAPPGNRNAVRHGAYVNGESSPEELALIADIEASFLRDFPGSDEDDIELIRVAAEACVVMNRALTADCADAAMRADRRFRKAIKALKAKKRRRSDRPQTTPADWAANLLKYSEEA
jgi:transposase